jgi:threonine aldolase
MREAMACAEVGDDVFCEDPTVRRLEETVAGLMGKEAALFVPSGTMANQIAILAQTRPGDEMLVGEGAHCAWYEAGAAAALSGVQPVTVGTGGLFTADDVQRGKKPVFDWYARTSLVALENTHNRGGGRVWPMEQLRSVTDRAKGLGLRLHLDGARIWNASAAQGIGLDVIAAPFDTVCCCFSKGLGAPVGSAICGTRELMMEARRHRKRLGGGMRQVGILAAAALYALEHHRARLVQDHEHARAIAEHLAQIKGARVDLACVQTNMVMVDTPGIGADKVAQAARRRGVLVAEFGPERIRIVTHLDVADTALEGGRRVGEAIRELAGATA